MRPSVVTISVLLLLRNQVIGDGFFKRVLPVDAPAYSNFEVASTYPGDYVSVGVCAAFTNVLSQDKSYSPNKLDYVNAFKFDQGVCQAGKIPYLDMEEWASKETVDRPGIYLNQGCVITKPGI